MLQERNAERRGTVPYRIKAAREEYKKLKPTLAAREREERRRKRQSRVRERVETETKTPEKISHLEERGDDERRMEQEEAHWWSRGEKKVPVVRQEKPEKPEGPPKTESPKMAKVLEKVEAPKGPLQIEVPVESSKPIDEEKCDTRDFRSKSNEAKEEETEVEPIPVEKTCVSGIKEHPMQTKEEQENSEDTKTEEGMRAMEVREYPEEKETRYSEEEGSRPSWDREESSSDVSSPSTIPVESVEWPEKEECLEVSSDENGYWSDSLTESSVTESVAGWLEGEERNSPMGGWRTLSPRVINLTIVTPQRESLRRDEVQSSSLSAEYSHL